ncbi:MAG: hypothetical protein EHM13_03905, partial [Acidobacteria bacterium]
MREPDVIASALEGEYEERSAAGAVLHRGRCAVTLGADTLTIAASGRTLAVDLGEIDSVSPADHKLSLAMLDGSSLVLQRFGRPYDDLARSIVARWRDRLVKCLLLADLDEGDRYDAWAALDGGPNEPSAAEVRLYESNLAVLPLGGGAFHWRLADIDSVEFDAARYVLEVASGSRRLLLSKAGRRADELRAGIEEGRLALEAKSAAALDRCFPFLGAARLARLAAVMQEGRLVPLAALDQIDRRLGSAVFGQPVDPNLRPYVAELRSRAETRGVYVAFSMIRPDREAVEDPPDTIAGEGYSDGDAGAGATDIERETLFWFVFVLECRLEGLQAALAWESTSQGGRATYLFGVPSGRETPVGDAVRTIERGLSRLNRRRGPVYLADAVLDGDARFRHYRLALRRVPEVRVLREAFLGRAVHSSVEG